MELDERIAFVTGGSSEIGQAAARALAHAGADVALQYLSNGAEAQKCVEQIQALGRRAFAIQGDLSAADPIAALFDAVLERFGRLDILVNGVGTVSPKKRIIEWTEEDWDHIVDATLKSVFFCNQRAAGIMMEQGWGRIINISSTSTKASFKAMTPYITAKGGVEAMTVALAVELAPFGITVNTVSPAIVPVQRNRNRWGFYQNQVVPYIPAGRLCQPEDIGAAVLMFASPSAGYITGQTLLVDGGWTSKAPYPLE